MVISSPTELSRRGMFRRLASAVGDLPSLAAGCHRQTEDANAEKETVVMRPPWAIDEPQFETVCRECDVCVPACPQQVIEIGANGPQMTFAHQGCDLCGKCVEVCPTGALDPAARRAFTRPWAWELKIAPGCLSVQGTQCRMCGDHCPEAALRFLPALGGRAIPEVAEDCTACGDCLAVCPVQALSLHPQPPAKTAD